MEFIFHYLWPSIKVCFKTVLKWVGIIGTGLLQFIIVTSINIWLGLALALVFLAIDCAIVRACCDYEEDKEREEQGWLPKNRDK